MPPRDFSNIFFEDLPANVQPLALHAYTSMGSFRIVKQDSVAVKYLNIYGIKIWGKQKDLTLYSENGSECAFNR